MWYMQLAAIAAFVMLMLDAYAWAQPAQSPSTLQKTLVFHQITLCMTASIAAMLHYVVRPRLLDAPCWSGHSAILARGVYAAFGSACVAVYPISRSLASFLPAHSHEEPAALTMLMFACYGALIFVSTLIGGVELAVALRRSHSALAAAITRAWVTPSEEASSSHVHVEVRRTSDASTDSDASSVSASSPAPASPVALHRRACRPVADAAAGMLLHCPRVISAAGTLATGRPPHTLLAALRQYTWRSPDADMSQEVQPAPVTGGSVWASKSPSCSIVTITALMSLLGVWSASAPAVVERVHVPLARLHPSLDGFTIAQLSDVHVGPTVGARRVRELVAAANALQPDIIVLTGDIMDGEVHVFEAGVHPLKQLSPRIPGAVYFVSGNHDHYEGDWKEKLRVLESLGVRVLGNDMVSLPPGASSDVSFDLAGVPDWSASPLSGAQYTHNMTAATKARTRSQARELIVLAHQPNHIFQASAAGAGLQLSGHTHAGQLFPLHLFAYLFNPFFSGLYAAKTAVPAAACAAPGVQPPSASSPAAAATAHVRGQLRNGGGALSLLRARAAVETDAKAAGAKHGDATLYVAGGEGQHTLPQQAPTGTCSWLTWIYVSRGSAFWGPPMRILAPAEVTLHTLRSVPALVAAQSV